MRTQRRLWLLTGVLQLIAFGAIAGCGSYQGRPAGAAANPSPVASPRPSWSPLGAPSPNPNGPTTAGDLSLGNGVYGNALLVAPTRTLGGPSVTWYWDGGNWHLAPGTSPRQANGHSIFYPPLHKTIVMSSGWMGDPMETWAWNGSSWSDLLVTPTGRSGGALLAFDAASSQLILNIGPTWVLNGSSWQPIGGFNSPEQRLGADMAYDPQHHQVVLFGGRRYSDPGLPVLADTWTWDGTGWTRRRPTTSPPAGGCDTMAYDPDLSQVVLLDETNCFSPGQPVEISMWSWEGTTWRPLHPATLPPAAGYPQLSYDLANHQLLLFEGGDGQSSASQTWIYEGGNWREVSWTPLGAL